MRATASDLMPDDIGRYIGTFLFVREALSMEIAFKTKYNDKYHYVQRLKYEPCSLRIGDYLVLCTYCKYRFKVKIIYRGTHYMMVLNRNSNTSRQALKSTVDLFGLTRLANPSI